MDKLQKKTFDTSRGYTYTYYLHKPDSAGKPALVFCHGWPDDAHLWADVIPYLLDSGHPLLIPDMLGYTGSSKPLDASAYTSKGLAGDLHELVASENLTSIIPVGHDWGSFLASRIYIWKPSICAGLVLHNVSYSPPNPSKPFDLDGANAMTTALVGYPCFAYWDVLAADDGPKLLRDNVETLFNMLHDKDDDGWKRAFVTLGATRETLTKAKPEDYEVRDYAKQPGFRQRWIERMTRDGFDGPQNWYRAFARNLTWEAEKEIPRENYRIEKPVLWICSSKDPLCLQGSMGLVKDLVPDLTGPKVVEAHHWGPYEKPKEVAGFLQEWLKSRYQ